MLKSQIVVIVIKKNFMEYSHMWIEILDWTNSFVPR